jgi:hypothetical protein
MEEFERLRVQQVLCRFLSFRVRSQATASSQERLLTIKSGFTNKFESGCSIRREHRLAAISKIQDDVGPGVSKDTAFWFPILSPPSAT